MNLIYHALDILFNDPNSILCGRKNKSFRLISPNYGVRVLPNSFVHLLYHRGFITKNTRYNCFTTDCLLFSNNVGLEYSYNKKLLFTDKQTVKYNSNIFFRGPLHLHIKELAKEFDLPVICDCEFSYVNNSYPVTYYDSSWTISFEHNARTI